MKKRIKSIFSVILALVCITVTGTMGKIGGIGDDIVMAAEDKISIFLAGDSTVCDWDAIRGEGYYEPQAGWGQMLGKYFDEDITVVNGAISGYSSKTFYQGCVATNDTVRHLDELLKDAKEGDYLLVQFGHNDSSKPTEEQLVTRPDIAERHVSTDEFKEYLTKYVEDAEAKGVIPVLVTPCARFSVSNGQFVSSFGSYVEAMKELAEEKDVLLIDLDAKSRAYYTELGEEGVKGVFLFCDAGVYPDSYYKDGASDKTHFQKFGAIQLARMIAEGLKELGITPLIENMNENVARPETAPNVPENIQIVKNQGTMLNFTWDEVEGADLYTVYRVATMPNGKELLSIAKQTADCRCIFTDLDKDKTYTYYVVSKNMVGESLPSERIIREGTTLSTTKYKGFTSYEIKDKKFNPIPVIAAVVGVIVVVAAVIAVIVIKKKKTKNGE